MAYAWKITYTDETPDELVTWWRAQVGFTDGCVTVQPASSPEIVVTRYIPWHRIKEVTWPTYVDDEPQTEARPVETKPVPGK